MMAVRQRRWSVVAISVATAFAWMFASNHCAIAAIAVAAKTSEHSCCHNSGAENKAPHNPTQCCEAFNVPVPEQASAPVAKLHELSPTWLPAPFVFAISVPSVETKISRYDTGPPGKSFSSLVLMKSLPAHGPPSVV